MAIIIKGLGAASIADKLVSLLKEKKSATWVYKNEKIYHITNQWKNVNAFFTYIHSGDSSAFFLRIEDHPADKSKDEISAAYYGQFIELLLYHFSWHLSSLEISLTFDDYEVI